MQWIAISKYQGTTRPSVGRKKNLSAVVVLWHWHLSWHPPMAPIHLCFRSPGEAPWFLEVMSFMVGRRNFQRFYKAQRFFGQFRGWNPQKWNTMKAWRICVSLLRAYSLGTCCHLHKVFLLCTGWSGQLKSVSNIKLQISEVGSIRKVYFGQKKHITWSRKNDKKKLKCAKLRRYSASEWPNSQQIVTTPEVEQRVFPWKSFPRFHGPLTSSISMNLNIAWKSTNVKSMTTLSQSQMTTGILF